MQSSGRARNDVPPPPPHRLQNRSRRRRRGLTHMGVPGRSPNQPRPRGAGRQVVTDHPVFISPNLDHNRHLVPMRTYPHIPLIGTRRTILQHENLFLRVLVRVLFSHFSCSGVLERMELGVAPVRRGKQHDHIQLEIDAKVSADSGITSCSDSSKMGDLPAVTYAWDLTDLPATGRCWSRSIARSRCHDVSPRQRRHPIRTRPLQHTRLHRNLACRPRHFTILYYTYWISVVSRTSRTTVEIILHDKYQLCMCYETRNGKK